MRLDPVRQASGGGLERIFRAGGNHQWPRPIWRNRPLNVSHLGRWLGENDMRICPAEAEGVHPGDAALSIIWKRFQCGRHPQFQAHHIDVGARVFKVQTRRNLAALEDEHRFHESDDARRCFQVAEIRLH